MWLHGFLTARTQAVAVDGHKSQPEVTSRVPQGCVPGPLLFLVLMADTDKTVTGSFLSPCAHNTALTHRTSKAQGVQLQASTQRAFRWADTNNMQLNEDKF